jgi:glycosyltransferase involved in cell wall biosynthesis
MGYTVDQMTGVHHRAEMRRASPDPPAEKAPAENSESTKPGEGPHGIPGVEAARELAHPIKVSVICPTYVGRHDRHQDFYRTFANQTYEHKELLVLDDGGPPSPFFSDLGTTDLRVRYEHRGVRSPIGEKRNRLVLAASGSVIAHFDDDDWYAPEYLSRMIDRLVDADADLVKLGVWRMKSPMGRRDCDVRRRAPNMVWGWGFSYVYRRYVATRVSFPHVSHAEDYAFVHGLHTVGMNTVLVEDGAHWVEKRHRDSAGWRER